MISTETSGMERQRLQLLLRRQSHPHRPSVENRVAFQWEWQGDLLGYKSGCTKDQITLNWLAEGLRHCDGEKAVLDVGCAYGNMLFMLNAKMQQPRDIAFQGIDLFSGSIEYAEAFAREIPGYETCAFQVGDIVKGLPFSAKRFDAVNMGDVLEHMDEPGEALKELMRVTKPGGVILISTPLRDGLFKKIAALGNALTRGKLYRQYYRGKDTDLDASGKPVMVTKAGNDHVSEMTWPELKRLFAGVGLKVRRVKMMSVMSGSRWFDRHPFLLSALMLLEAVHGVCQFPSWAHSVIVELENPKMAPERA
jgi:SAM-dependent methyltransferase